MRSRRGRLAVAAVAGPHDRRGRSSSCFAARRHPANRSRVTHGGRHGGGPADADFPPVPARRARDDGRRDAVPRRSEPGKPRTGRRCSAIGSDRPSAGVRRPSAPRSGTSARRHRPVARRNSAHSAGRDPGDTGDRLSRDPLCRRRPPADPAGASRVFASRRQVRVSFDRRGRRGPDERRSPARPSGASRSHGRGGGISRPSPPLRSRPARRAAGAPPRRRNAPGRGRRRPRHRRR